MRLRRRALALSLQLPLLRQLLLHQELLCELCRRHVLLATRALLRLLVLPPLLRRKLLRLLLQQSPKKTVCWLGHEPRVRHVDQTLLGILEEEGIDTTHAHKYSFEQKGVMRFSDVVQSEFPWRTCNGLWLLELKCEDTRGNDVNQHIG